MVSWTPVDSEYTITGIYSKGFSIQEGYLTEERHSEAVEPTCYLSFGRENECAQPNRLVIPLYNNFDRDNLITTLSVLGHDPDRWVVKNIALYIKE